jgi:hypothetical protein
LVSESNDFEHAVASVMYHARTLVSQAKQAAPEWENEMKSLTEHVKTEWEENWYDGLGFCSHPFLAQLSIWLTLTRYLERTRAKVDRAEGALCSAEVG